jgi:hypothetical protein
MKKAVILVLLLAVLVGAGFAWFNRGTGATGEPVRLPVYFTCDTHGRLEPCGCFTGQLGGLTRAQSWLGQRRLPDSLLVDIGGSIAGREDYHVIQYRYILDAYHTMGYQALNLGAREAELDATTLRELGGHSKVPLLSASIVHAGTRQPVLAPSTVVTINERKIGILAVLDPRSVAAPGPDIAILSLDDAISRHLPALAAESDELILLAFAPEAELHRLAREFYEFPLILGGDVKQPSQHIAIENQSTILFTTNEARTVGQVTLVRTGGAVTTADFDINMLYPNIAQAKEIAALSKAFRKQIRKTTLAVDNPDAPTANSIPGVKPLATYVGSQSCKTCHEEDYKIWKKSGHAKAFDTLVRRESDADPTCIGCHTVGFGEPSGYRRAYGDEKLTDVGCESCHGPGSEHVAQWRIDKPPAFKFRPLGAGDCIQCHYGEFSRPFDWDEFWPPVKHGE